MSYMELTASNNAGTHSSNHTGAIAFDLVSELLAVVLACQDEEIIVESRSRNFIYDPGTEFAASQSLKIVIAGEDVTEKGDKIEVYLSGKVENEKGQKTTCTLYFCLWWDNTANPLFKDSYTKILEIDATVIEFQNRLESLADSVFGLDLYKKDQAGMRCPLGHGRGYLVFGRRV